MATGSQPSTLILWYIVLAFGLMFGGDLLGFPTVALVGGLLVMLLLLGLAAVVIYLIVDRRRNKPSR